MFVPVPPNPTPASPLPPPRPLAPEVEEDLRTVVGTNADYYLSCWRRVLTGRGTGAGFNRIAFFLPILWMVYRRMYQQALILFGLIFAVGLFQEIFFVVLLEFDRSPLIITIVEGFSVSVVCGS